MAEDKFLERLTNIKKLSILNRHQIYLQSEGATLVRLDENGANLEDRQYLEAETGKVKEQPNARKQDEITLDVGQSCIVGLRYGGTLKVVQIKKNSVIFEETVPLREQSARLRKRRVEAAPYE